MVTALLAMPVPLPDPVVESVGEEERPVAEQGRPAAAELPLDATERAAVAAFLQAGLVDPGEAAGVRARREPWGAYRAVS